uniref:coilin-like n=1 Tax=Styela clava TaxID=7725 RepID=UPI001939293D|nr:coilin-like [Styela clava]
MPSTGKQEQIRIKLIFENAPPEMPSSSKYMILVKPAICGTVHDLENLIIRKFGFPKGVTVSLTLDGFVLLSTEEIFILDDNDCVSVSILYDIQKKQTKKRKLCSNEEETKSKTVKTHEKRKKKITKIAKFKKASGKIKPTKRKADTSDTSSTDNGNCKINGIKLTNGCSNNEPSQNSIKTKSKILENQNKITNQNILKLQMGEGGVKFPTNTLLCKHSSTNENIHLAKVSKSFSQITPNSNKQHMNNISDNSIAKINNDILPIPSHSKVAEFKATGHVTFSSSSDSEMETDTHKQHSQQANNSLKVWLKSGTTPIHREVAISKTGSKKLTDPGVSTNTSVIYNNPSQTNSKDSNKSDKNEYEKHSRDYSTLLPSTWPPRIGDIIAYKLLEMSENYTPVISEYKEAKVMEIYTSGKSPIGVDSVKLEILWPKHLRDKKKTGRFEMDLSDDEPDDMTNEQLLEWQVMLEPRRID